VQKDSEKSEESRSGVRKDSREEKSKMQLKSKPKSKSETKRKGKGKEEEGLRRSGLVIRPVKPKILKTSWIFF